MDHKRDRRPSRRVCAVSACLGLFAAAGASAQQTTRPGGQSPERRPTVRTETCLTNGCHSSVTRAPNLHAPVAQGTCRACHADLEPRDHTFRLTDSAEKLCYSCHSISLRDVIHKPVADGRCTDCHDPHGSPHKMLLTKDPATQLCNECHADAGYAQRKYVHGPVAIGACILCHEAHSSWHPKLLAKPAEQACASCHAEVRAAVLDRRHPHDPVRDGPCTSCHDPHASDFRGQLKSDGVTLCTGCHEPIRQAIATSPVVHGAAAEQDACVNCHVGHASDLPMLQRLGQPASCLTCHDRVVPDHAGRSIADMAALLRDNPNHHGPIREGFCTACHDPHASQRFRLLTADYPPEFYAPFSIERYDLCFKCHRTELATSAEGEGVTGFRDGGRNLHFVHVNQEKGRTCRACHEVHASANPFHMRDAVPFGQDGWLLEIGYYKTDEGGTCASACHKPRSYSRSGTGVSPVHGAQPPSAVSGPAPAPTTNPAGESP